MNQSSPFSHYGFGDSMQQAQQQHHDVFDTSSLMNSLPQKSNMMSHIFQTPFVNQNDSSSYINSFSNYGSMAAQQQQQQLFYKQPPYDHIMPHKQMNSTLSNELFVIPQQLLNQQILFQQRQKVQIYESILPVVLSEDAFEEQAFNKYFSGKYTFAHLTKRGNIATLKRSFGDNENDYLKELEMIK